jgi:HlyD family secretion protein
MLKKKRFWIIVVFIVIIAAGGGYYYFRIKTTASASSQTSEPAMQTATARLGDITISASGTGQVIPVSQISLGFDDSGTLSELSVAVGDQVKSGQILARMQTKDTPDSIAASIASAEMDVINAKNALSDLNTTAETNKIQALNDIATYEQAVRDAQYQLENYAPPITFQGLTPAAAVDKTKKELDIALQAFEPYKYKSEYDSVRESYLEKLNDAQSNYDAAVKWLGYQYALETAQANLNQANLQYEKYKDGPSNQDIQAAQADLENAQAQLKVAKSTQSILNLIAPIDGTVMDITSNVGEVVSTSPIITIADLKQTMLDVYLDETDLDKAVVGNAAEVVFDALPNQTFKGKVVSVNPGLVTVSNVQAVEVKVLLDSTDQQTNLPVGLNASVDVVSGSATNVILVPVEALHELAPGEYGVFVVQNGTTRLRVVKVGLQDITSAEITSGLQAGEVVSTGIVKAQ